jgi:hypothetical protein
VLQHRAYLSGTRYYQTAESFLYLFSQLLPHLHNRNTLLPLLRARILERAGAPGDALALAMRVLAGMAVGVRLEREMAEMVLMQEEDGGWGACWVYKYGSSGIKIGNRGLSTAFALKAISALQSKPQQRPPLRLLAAPKRRTREPGSPMRLRAHKRSGGHHDAGLGITQSWPFVTFWLVLLSLCYSQLVV